MFSESVALRAKIFGKLLRIAHANEIRCDTSSYVFNVGTDVPPQIRRRRIAVEEDDGITGAAS